MRRNEFHRALQFPGKKTLALLGILGAMIQATIPALHNKHSKTRTLQHNILKKYILYFMYMFHIVLTVFFSFENRPVRKTKQTLISEADDPIYFATEKSWNPVDSVYSR